MRKGLLVFFNGLIAFGLVGIASASAIRGGVMYERG